MGVLEKSQLQVPELFRIQLLDFQRQTSPQLLTQFRRRVILFFENGEVVVCEEIFFRQFTSLTYHTKLVAAAKPQNHVKIYYFHSSQTHKADNEFDRFQVVICIRKRLVGLKPTSRNSELIFRKRNPLAVFLDRASEFNIRIINSLLHC